MRKNSSSIHSWSMQSRSADWSAPGDSVRVAIAMITNHPFSLTDLVNPSS